MPSPVFDCYAVAAPGVEGLTARELGRLGLAPGATEPGGVEFRADLAGVQRANLHLRTASRILVRLGSFRAAAFHELERRGARLPWTTVLAPGAPIDFRVTSRRSKLYHQRAIAERLARVAADAAGATWVRAGGADGGTDAGDDETDGGSASQLFVVRLHRDVVTVSADTSGAHLHRRGYRRAVARAPLRETLAAAMLLAIDWDGTAPLVDPMCGSGTIPIEAALLARRIPPGLRRSFAFERWPGFDAAEWRRLRDAASADVLPSAPVRIQGSDRDAGAIEAALANAERAGVGADVELRRAAISAIDPPPGPGALVTNPPYGVRVGERAALRSLFAQLGNVARRRCPGWTIAFLSVHPALAGQVGMPLEPRLATTNGGLRVQLVVGRVPAD